MTVFFVFIYSTCNYNNKINNLNDLKVVSQTKLKGCTGSCVGK